MKKYISVLVLVLVFCLASCSIYQSSPYIKEPITKENGIGFAEYESWSLVSGMFPGLPVVLDLQHKDFPQDSIQYTIHANIGRYESHRPKGTWLDQEFTIGNNSVICWTSIHSDFEDPDQFAFHDYGDGADDYHIVFTDIIIRCENHIIGYAVICFDRTAYITDDNPTPHQYDLLLTEAFLFPKYNGEYQEIPEEYVLECITRAIEKYS